MSYVGEYNMMTNILCAFGVVILAALIVPAFLSSQFSMSRSIEIQAPVGVVFSKLTNLNEYVKWNPFPESDPSNQTNVSGDGVGSFLVG